MAIQAQMYSDNNFVGLPFSSQDWFTMETNNNNNNTIMNNNFNNSCGFSDFSSFNLQQKQQQQQQQQQQLLLAQFQNMQQRNYSNNNNNNPTTTTTTTSNHVPMNLSQTLSSQIEQHRQEVDRYVSLQNERLKVALEEQRKNQLGAILKKVEERATMLLTQKDNEITKARNRTTELEQYMRKIEAENQTWQRLATENETMVFSLSNKLEEVKEQVCLMASSNGVNDAESCCDEEESRMMMSVCKGCNCRNVSVLFLPCRHLCCCSVCEPFLDYCPVCKSDKKGCIEALIS